MQQHQDKAQELKQLLSYLRQDPDNDKLRAAVFDAALAAGEFAEANFQVVHARHVRPDDIPWRHREALLLLAQGQYAEARERFDRPDCRRLRRVRRLPTTTWPMRCLRAGCDGRGAGSWPRRLRAAAGRSRRHRAWALWLRCLHQACRSLDEALAGRRRCASETTQSLPARRPWRREPAGARRRPGGPDADRLGAPGRLTCGQSGPNGGAGRRAGPWRSAARTRRRPRRCSSAPCWPARRKGAVGPASPFSVCSKPISPRPMPLSSKLSPSCPSISAPGSAWAGASSSPAMPRQRGRPSRRPCRWIGISARATAPWQSPWRG